jgi:iron complex transport system substrate-binding protein
MKKICLVLILCASVLVLCCQRSNAPSGPVPEHPAQASRVVALSSSIAEIWLLAGGTLAGVTSDAITERDFALSPDIRNMGGIISPNLELILETEPDLVLFSPDLAAHQSIAQTLGNIGVSVYAAKVESLDDYLRVLQDFTRLTGNHEAFERNGVQVQTRIAALLSRLPDADGREEKTALFLRAYSSGITTIADEHPVCTILDDIGVRNIARQGALAELSVEKILDADPDFIFIVSQGNEEKAALNIERSLTSHPAWASLKAIQTGRLVILPKALFHFKPNVRWAEAYEYILNIVYPNLSQTL